MADDKEKEEKFDFTAEGEGYITLGEARLLAIQTASRTPGVRRRRYRNVLMAFEVVSATEDEETYDIVLSYRPQGDFTGTPGQEHFIIGKHGDIILRQVLFTPKEPSSLPILPISIGVVVVGIIAAVGTVFALGGNGAPVAAVSTIIPVPLSEETVVPTPVAEAAVGVTQVPIISAVGDSKYGGNIRMSAYADVLDWDPLGSASLSSVSAYSQLYNQLVQFSTGSDTTAVVGDLADSWDISNAGTTFTFHLNEDATWGDGTDVTSDDVVYALSRYMDPENSIGRSGLFRNYTLSAAEGGIKKVDDSTVEMNLSFASGAFINFLALDYAKILPKHILEAGTDLNQAEGIMESRSESGPFLLDDYQRGNTYSVSKNPNYFKEGKPYFDSIEHYIITDTGTLIAQFKAGQLDMMNGGFSSLSPTEYLELDADTKGSANGHVIANEMPGSRNWGLMMNTKAEKLKDPRIRKAIYLALDRAQLNDVLEDGTGDIPCALWGMGYSLEDCETFPGIRDKNSDGGKADIAYAKQLMADAGVPDGFTVTYDARQVGNYPDVCSVIRQQLSYNLGIEGEITTHVSTAGYALYATSRSGTGDWELACQGEGMTVFDPDALLGGIYLAGGHRNYSKWQPRVARTWFEVIKVKQDPVKRRQILKDYEDFLIPTDPDDISKGFVDNHWVTLYWGKFFWLTNEDIRGFNAPKTVQHSFKHEDLWLDR